MRSAKTILGRKAEPTPERGEFYVQIIQTETDWRPDTPGLPLWLEEIGDILTEGRTRKDCQTVTDTFNGMMLSLGLRGTWFTVAGKGGAT